jgi:hypothetical protein
LGEKEFWISLDDFISTFIYIYIGREPICASYLNAVKMQQSQQDFMIYTIKSLDQITKFLSACVFWLISMITVSVSRKGIFSLDIPFLKPFFLAPDVMM